MLTRRTLLAGAALLPTVAQAKPKPSELPLAAEDDAAFWARIQGEFTLDRSLINLNNGGVSPSPRVVHEALKRYLDLTNMAPAHYLWGTLEPGVETIRRELAVEANCDAEELAVTRNASEALQIAQLGIPLAPGDHVLTTDQDYPRMLDTWEQRVARDGIVLDKVSFPVPLPSPEVLVEAFARAITPKTRVIHVSQLVFMTGQVLPVQQVCALARERGIVSIVDGAHAFAHVPTDLRAMGCDYYGTSLHKWLLAPIGTGFLYMRRDRIADHWPLTPGSASLKANIRKFEEIGTHPAANHDAIGEALVFHRGIGAARKYARLHALRMHWRSVLEGHPNLTFNTPKDPAWSGAIELVSVKGKEPGALVSELWSRWRIIATPIVHPQFQGIRVTPNLYTTFDELDRFAGALRELAG